MGRWFGVIAEHQGRDEFWAIAKSLGTERPVEEAVALVAAFRLVSS